MGGSNLGINITGTSRLLFVGLSRSNKLGEYLETEGELLPAGQGMIGCKTFPDEVGSERKQAWPRVREHEFRELLIQLMEVYQSTLEQRNGDGNVIFTLEAS
jgi:hypothetical protein